MVEMWPLVALVAISATAIPTGVMAWRRDWKGLRHLLTSVGLSLSLGFSILLVAIWTFAFAGGGDALVSVNAQKEAHVELLALAFSVPLIAYATLRLMAQQLRGVRRAE